MIRRQQIRNRAKIALTALLLLAGANSLPAQVVASSAGEVTACRIDNATIVRDFLAAVQRGDRKQVESLLHPNVQWHQPGENAISGLKPSRDAVFAMSAKIHAHTAHTYKITEISALSTNGSGVAVRLHFSAANPVMVLDVDNIDVFTIQNGLITNVTVYSANVDHENAFWGL